MRPPIAIGHNELVWKLPWNYTDSFVINDNYDIWLTFAMRREIIARDSHISCCFCLASNENRMLSHVRVCRMHLCGHCIRVVMAILCRKKLKVRFVSPLQRAIKMCRIWIFFIALVRVDVVDAVNECRAVIYVYNNTLSSEVLCVCVCGWVVLQPLHNLYREKKILRSAIRHTHS